MIVVVIMLNCNIPLFSIISIQILTSHLIISILLVPVLPMIMSKTRKRMMIMMMVKMVVMMMMMMMMMISLMVVVVVVTIYSTILLLLVVVLLQRYRALKRVFLLP